jgi:hypothetical protein
MRPFIAPTYDQACFLRRNVLPFTVFFAAATVSKGEASPSSLAVSCFSVNHYSFTTGN